MMVTLMESTPRALLQIIIMMAKVCVRPDQLVHGSIMASKGKRTIKFHFLEISW